jgi:hypothetical protein
MTIFNVRYHGSVLVDADSHEEDFDHLIFYIDGRAKYVLPKLFRGVTLGCEWDLYPVAKEDDLPPALENQDGHRA